MLFTPVKFSILFHYQISIFFSPYSISARTNSSGRYMFVVTGIIFLRITHYIHFQRQPLFSFFIFLLSIDLLSSLLPSLSSQNLSLYISIFLCLLPSFLPSFFVMHITIWRKIVIGSLSHSFDFIVNFL